MNEITTPKPSLARAILFSFLASVVGLLAVIIFYLFVAVPVLPCISVIVCAMIAFRGDRIIPARIACWVIAIVGIILYGAGAIEGIMVFPDKGNVFYVIFRFITAFSFLGGGIVWGSVKKI